MREIERKQIVLIHLAKNQLNLDDPEYRFILRERFGVQSSKELSYERATELIGYFKRLGFRIRSKRKCSICAPRPKREGIPDNVMYLVSPQQLAMIEHLRQDIHWKTWDGYQRWLLKYFGLRQVKLSLEASAVIEGLKGLWKSQNKCECRFNSSEFGVRSSE